MTLQHLIPVINRYLASVAHVYDVSVLILP